MSEKNASFGRRLRATITGQYEGAPKRHERSEVAVTALLAALILNNILASDQAPAPKPPEYPAGCRMTVIDGQPVEVCTASPLSPSDITPIHREQFSRPLDQREIFPTLAHPS